MSKIKIIAGIGFNPFVNPNAQLIIKIGDKIFPIVGKESHELAPYPCMSIDKRHLVETLKEIIRELEINSREVPK